MKNNKGITLIALVITIIVLLILAGVVIATLSGPNGLINKAKSAKDTTNVATAKEKISVALADAYADVIRGTLPTVEDLKAQNPGIDEAAVTTLTNTTADGVVKITCGGYEGKITYDSSKQVYSISDITEIPPQV